MLCVVVISLLNLVLHSTQDMVDWHTTTLLYIYICFHDYHIVIYIIVFHIKNLKQSLIYRSAGLLWVTCVGVIGHQLQLKVHISKHHMNRLESLFQALVKHGLKLSPKKCHLFIKELVIWVIYLLSNIIDWLFNLLHLEQKWYKKLRNERVFVEL